MKNRKPLLLLMLAVVLVLSACGGQGGSSESSGDQGGDSQESGSSGEGGGPIAFDFAAATKGGSWYPLAGAMGDEITNVIDGSSVRVIEGGSVSNLIGIENGKFELGFSNGQTVPQALKGVEPFKKKAENIAWIASLYPNVMHIVARADSDIHTIEDLKGKNVSPGIKGYSGELAFQRVLKIHGMTYDDLGKVEYVGTSDAASLLRDGHIDAMAIMVSAPNATFQQLATTLGIRLIPISDEAFKKLHEQNSGFQKFTFEPGIYGNEKPVQTFQATTTMLVNTSMLDEKTVYKITKIVNENADKWQALLKAMEVFDSEFSINHKVGPIAPGAKKYYKEIGVLE